MPMSTALHVEKTGSTTTHLELLGAWAEFTTPNLCVLQDMLSALGKLSEVVQQRYSAVVPTSIVWGYGRPLWDPTARKHGLKPLRVMLLGPAASGKSTQCAMLAARWVMARRCTVHTV